MLSISKFTVGGWGRESSWQLLRLIDLHYNVCMSTLISDKSRNDLGLYTENGWLYNVILVTVYSGGN